MRYKAAQATRAPFIGHPCWRIEGRRGRNPSPIANGLKDSLGSATPRSCPRPADGSANDRPPAEPAHTAQGSNQEGRPVLQYSRQSPSAAALLLAPRIAGRSVAPHRRPAGAPGGERSAQSEWSTEDSKP